MKQQYFRAVACLMVIAATMLGIPANARTDDGVKNTDDRRAFGLIGNVKSVSTITREADVVDGKLVPGERNNGDDVMSFTKQGWVLIDLYGNEYDYDAQGRFVGKLGSRGCATSMRSVNGQITAYTDVCDEEDIESRVCEFFYDEQGRMKRVEMTFWESTFNIDYIYDGDSPHVTVIHTEQFDQGSITRTDYVMTYTDFDAQGNWTRREVMVSRTESEETGDEGETEPTYYTTHEIETRTLTYY